MLRPRSPPQAPPSSFPPRTGGCHRCAPQSPPSRPRAAPCFRQGGPSMASASRSPSRLSVRFVTRDCPIHGAVNSGRKVTISSTGSVFILVHSPAECFDARRIDPMHILEDHQHRTVACKRLDLRVNASRVFCRRCCGVSSSVGSVHRSAVTACRRTARRHVLEVDVNASNTSSLSSFACCVVSVRQSCGTFHLADYRIERAVGVLR